MQVFLCFCDTCLPCVSIIIPSVPWAPKKMRQNKHFLLSLNWLVKSFVIALIKSIYCSMLLPCRSSTYFIFVISSLIKRLIELSNVSLCNILSSNNKKVAEVQDLCCHKKPYGSPGSGSQPMALLISEGYGCAVARAMLIWEVSAATQSHGVVQSELLLRSVTVSIVLLQLGSVLMSVACLYTDILLVF